MDDRAYSEQRRGIEERLFQSQQKWLMELIQDLNRKNWADPHLFGMEGEVLDAEWRTIEGIREIEG